MEELFNFFRQAWTGDQPEHVTHEGAGITAERRTVW